jgi:hypothetical protein
LAPLGGVLLALLAFVLVVASGLSFLPLSLAAMVAALNGR